MQTKIDTTYIDSAELSTVHHDVIVQPADIESKNRFQFAQAILNATYPVVCEREHEWYKLRRNATALGALIIGFGLGCFFTFSVWCALAYFA